MSRLPIFSGRELVKIFGRLGYRIVRERGSHMRLACPSRKSITIPNHKIIDRSLLMKILRDAELTAENFEKLLKI